MKSKLFLVGLLALFLAFGSVFIAYASGCPGVTSGKKASTCFYDADENGEGTFAYCSDGSCAVARAVSRNPKDTYISCSCN